MVQPKLNIFLIALGNRLMGRQLGPSLRYCGLVLLAIAVGTSTLTFNWVIAQNPQANFFPEFAGQVVYLSDIFMVTGVVLWSVGWHLSPSRNINYGPRYVFLPLLVLVLLTVLSVIWADNVSQAGFAAVRRVLLLGLYLALVNETRRALLPVSVVLISLGLAHSAVALAQVYSGSATGLAQLGEIDQAALGFGGIGSSRAYGLGFNPNPVGAFLAVVSLLSFGLFLLGDRGLPFRALTVVSGVITLLGIVSTSSRSALLGWLVGISAITILGWYWARPDRGNYIRRAGVLGLAVFLIAAIYLAYFNAGDAAGGQGGAGRFTGVLDRFRPEQVTEGLDIRASDLSLSFQIIKEHPFLGVGAGNYPTELHNRLNPDTPGGIYTPPHNVPLTLLAELGVAGLIAWMFIIGAPIIWVVRNWKNGESNSSPLIWLGPLLVVLFEGFWDFTPWATQDGRVLLMGVLAMWAGAVSRMTYPSQPQP